MAKTHFKSVDEYIASQTRGHSRHTRARADDHPPGRARSRGSDWKHREVPREGSRRAGEVKGGCAEEALSPRYQHA